MSGILPHWSTSIAEWAKRDPLILQVYAFGSRVKGDYHPESDLDLAMDVAGQDEGEKLGNAIFERQRWTEELTGLLPIKPDIQCMMPDDVVVTPAVGIGSAAIVAALMFVRRR